MELIPFLGHVGIEKLMCNIVSKDPDDDREYIRIIVNSVPRQFRSVRMNPERVIDLMSMYILDFFPCLNVSRVLEHSKAFPHLNDLRVVGHPNIESS